MYFFLLSRIVTTLLDKPEIGPLIIDRIILDVIRKIGHIHDVRENRRISFLIFSGLFFYLLNLYSHLFPVLRYSFGHVSYC